MTIIDANLLLYAYNADAPQQKASAQWLQKLLKSGGIIGLPWVTLWAFIRISTKFQTLGESEIRQGSICNRWRMAEATRRRSIASWTTSCWDSGKTRQ